METWNNQISECINRLSIYKVEIIITGEYLNFKNDL